MKNKALDSELRNDILRGHYAPAAWLRLEELKSRFEIGFSPIREALARLAGEGLVELEPNRGFRVAGLSRADLADIALARCAIETVALRRSIELGDDEWEADVLSAMHRYRRKSEAAFASEDGLRAWEAAHEALHAALIGACASPRLMASQKLLQDQHMRYRRIIVIPQVSADVHVEEHERLVGLALDRRVEEAVAQIGRHMMITVDALDRTKYWETVAAASG